MYSIKQGKKMNQTKLKIFSKLFQCSWEDNVYILSTLYRFCYTYALAVDKLFNDIISKF